MLKALFQKILSAARRAWIVCGLILMAANLPQRAEAFSMVFGREELFTLNAGNISALKNSGFTTVILFVVDVAANGDLNYNGNHLIVTNGVYMGDAGWGARLAALKQAPTTINRIEVCTGGAGAQSWLNIKNLIAAQGTGSSSILYSNFVALKNALGVDAICNDDEVAYDAASAATFNNMITALGMKNTLCPYNNPAYWQSIFNNSVIDRVYLQCYDGGAGNNPATWNGYFGGFKVSPGDWNNDSPAVVDSKFTGWAPVINGGFMWQLELIGDANLASYASVINRAVDPLVISPTTGFAGLAAYNQRSLPMSTPFTLTNSSSSSISWSVINTSSWLNVSNSLGTLAAGAATSVTASLNTTMATNLAPGIYSASLVFSNKTSGVAVTRNFSLNTAIANWPVALTGFTAALLASNSATAGSPGATAFDIPNNYCFYQAGLSGGTRGLPLGGAFPSLVDSATAFQFGKYGAADALLHGYNYAKSGTLTLVTPEAFNSLAVLASSANGGGTGTFVINFADGSQSSVFSFNAQDWFFNTANVAIQGFGRLKLGASLSIEDNGAANPNLYQTTVNLAAWGLIQPVTSITFSNPATAGATQNTAVFAVSGMPRSIPVAAPTGLVAVPGTNAIVRLTWAASAGATNYNVRRTQVSGGGYGLAGSTSGTSFTNTGLANGSTYYFVVSAVGTANESVNSAEVSAMPGSYRGWILGANPLAYWPLNDAVGPVAGELVAGSNGVFAGAYTLGLAGAIGAGFGTPHRAAHYDGVSAYTQLPRLIGGTNFSIVFWVQTSTTGGSPNWYSGKGLVDGEVSGVAGDFGVALVGAKVGFGIGNPDYTLASIRTINNGLWHQVAVTRDSGSGAMSIYIDGTFDSSGTGPTGPKADPPFLRVGSIQTGTGFLIGNVSDVAMYDRVLTANQVATLYYAATGIFYDVTVTNQWNGANLVLSWPGNGRLIEATNLSGPWITNASVSPATVIPNQPQKFYRIRTQ